MCLQHSTPNSCYHFLMFSNNNSCFNSNLLGKLLICQQITALASATSNLLESDCAGRKFGELKFNPYKDTGL